VTLPGLPKHTALSPVNKPITYVEYDCQEAEAGGEPEDEHARLILISSDENLGFSEGNNVGLRYAHSRHAKYCFILNNDAMCADSVLRQLIRCSERTGGEMVGPVVMNRSGSEVLFSGRKWPDHLFGSGKVKLTDTMPEYWTSGDIDGCAMLLGRGLISTRMAEYGYVFDPAMFMYCEDTDLCLYGRSRGYGCYVVRDAVVYHGLAGSSGGKGNPVSYYYLTRNRMLLARRWLSGGLKLLFALYYVPTRIINQVVHVGRLRSGVFRAVAQGLMDGFRGVSGRWNQHNRRHG
jgi:GT2 family glycosyltransferase